LILITGGLGYIGSHCIVELLQNHFDVICIDNLSNSNIETINTISKITDRKFIYENIDITNKEALNKIFDSYKISSIMHFAGLKSVRESIELPNKYYFNNVFGSETLFQLTKDYEVKNLIFSSSATVYGNPKKLPITENHSLHALNPYAQNKIDIEKILLNDDYFMNQSSVKILRYFNPIGAHPSNLLGENPIGVPNNLMPFILNVAKGMYPKLQIYGGDYDTKDGTGVRDYIHVMDLVHGHIKALNYKKNGVNIFNLGNGKGYSVLELVSIFEKVNKISIPFEIVARRSGDVDKIYSDFTLAKKELGYFPEKTIEDMCIDAWNFAKNSKKTNN
jgi:UDP-glucose 4-epimerase